MDCSPPESFVYGVFPARILEWVAMSSSRGSSRPRDQTYISCVFWNSSIFFTAEFTRNLLKTFRLLQLCSALAAVAAKSLQSCPTLCDPIDGSPPGSPIPGILQAKTLEWVAISFSNAWKWKVKVKSLSHVWCFTTPWTAAYQAPPPMGFSRQEYWSGVPLPSPNHQFSSVHLLSHVQLFVTPWTTAYQAPPSMGFSRQEYWSGVLNS